MPFGIEHHPEDVIPRFKRTRGVEAPWENFVICKPIPMVNDAPAEVRAFKIIIVHLVSSLSLLFQGGIARWQSVRSWRTHYVSIRPFPCKVAVTQDCNV